MKRITDEKISKAKKGHTAIIELKPSVFESDIAVAQAQLEACEEELRGIFEEIEKDSYIEKHYPWGRDRYLEVRFIEEGKYQSLKSKILGE